MGVLRYNCGAQTFAGIHEGVQQHQSLKRREGAQSTPRIVNTTKKSHGSHDNREDKSRLSQSHAAPHRKPTGSRKDREQYRYTSEQDGVIETKSQRGP